VIADCDVALIPYRLTDWTSACLPIKVFEYLAEGKPVIATPLPELEGFSDVLTLASPDRFEAAIVEALGDSEQAAGMRRRQAASRFTLQARAVRAGQLLHDRAGLAAAG
jgi:glycosyltransferase involved in cell wall biosynthesis